MYIQKKFKYRFIYMNIKICINSGVPQGSIVLLTLLLLFFNDL